MKIFGLEITRSKPQPAETKQATDIPLNTLLERLDALQRTASGITVTPETAMQAPTVHAIVTGIARRIATLPVKVQRETMRGGRKINEDLPNHWLNRLLRQPNDWQDRVTFWLDATSWLVRYGNSYWAKAQGATGPVRRLIPVPPFNMNLEYDFDTLDLTYRGQFPISRQYFTWRPSQIVHARTAARDGVVGDSPVMDIREAIALEIAAEKMGSEVFGNSATPGPVFEFADGFQGFKSDEERNQFVEGFQAAYNQGSRWRAMLLPKGIKFGDRQGIVDNEKAQYLELRQYQRSVIAGAFNVPLHIVGDLSKGTFNNVHEQNRDVIINVVSAYVQVFEAALERSLLSDEDRRAGVVIRFDFTAALRADFKQRQEGLHIQRQAGVINANEWREREGLNPISEEDGGEEYWRQGPSGQSADGPEPSGDGDEGEGDEGEGEDAGEENGDGNGNAETRSQTNTRKQGSLRRRAMYHLRGKQMSDTLAKLPNAPPERQPEDPMENAA